MSNGPFILPQKLTTTANEVGGGIDATDGRGNEYLFGVTGTFQQNDEITLIVTDNSNGYQTQIGAGYASNVAPTFCYTFNQKIHALDGSSDYFSALGLPTTWNDPTAAGNGFVTMSNWFASPASMQAIAPYQGRLLFACRDYVMIWTVDADPASNILNQTLPNIGTYAPMSVQAVGDMDVYMLYDSGVRSVRVRDASNNAIIADIGTPVDLLIQSAVAGLTDAQKSAACGVVDPAANRYWLYIPGPTGNPTAGLIYVFSYFTSSGVAAWSTYQPTYQQTITPFRTTYPSSGTPIISYGVLSDAGDQYAWNPGPNEVSMSYNGVIYTQGTLITTVAGDSSLIVTGKALSATYTGQLNIIKPFIPLKFEIYAGQVWCLGQLATGYALFQYGGPGNSVYENCGVQAVTPYIDSGLPGHRKTFEGIEAAFVGTWGISASADYTANNFRSVYLNNASTYYFQKIGWAARGTHYALQFNEFSTGYARLSNALVHFAPPPQGAEK